MDGGETERGRKRVKTVQWRVDGRRFLAICLSQLLDSSLPSIRQRE